MRKLLLIVLTLLLSLYATAQTAWPDSIYTAQDATYLTPEERLVVAELNKVRTNPQRYVREVLEPFLETFEDPYPNIYICEDGTRMLTNEGQAAVRECIAVLRKAKPLPMLYPVLGLAKAAKLHAADQRGGATGHVGSNGSKMADRLNKYGKWGTYCGENIAYGYPLALHIVRQLMIDDGVSSRGHRKNILDQRFRYVGIGIDTHARYGHSCTMDFAADYTNK